MKLETALKIRKALIELGNTKLPAKVSYRVAKAMGKLANDFNAFDKASFELAKEFLPPTEDGNGYALKGQGLEAYSKAIDDLGAQEIDVKLDTFTLEELGGIVIEPMHLAALDGVMLTKS